MSNSGLLKKQNLIREYHQELKSLNAQKGAITKRINILKIRFEELIEVEADLDQLLLFEDMDELLKSNDGKTS